MVFLYKEIKKFSSNDRIAVQRLSDSTFIPLDTQNRDYKEYLEKVTELGEENILEPAS